MTRITQDLILKKSEHHDGLLADLEEISLHQLHIEKLEVIGSICRKLKILYLQNNLIGKIENINKLKDLRYLNLALNNIERIENLDGCEKLERLDLTVNFVSVESLEASLNNLKDLIFFEELYLVGNPCTDWPLYRAYAISALPRLRRLDGKDVTRLEREEAVRDMALLRAELRLRAAAARDTREAEEAARAERGSGRSRVVSSSSHGGVTIEEVEGDDGEGRRFTPALRLEMYREEQEQERAREEEKQRPSAFAPAPDLVREAYDKLNQRELPREDGSRPRQRNPGRFDFSLQDSADGSAALLSVSVPRFLDTSALTVDVHPEWVQVLIKGKNLLVHLDAPVRVEAALVQRVRATGQLVLTMPYVDGDAPVSAQRGAAEARARAHAHGEPTDGQCTAEPPAVTARAASPAQPSDGGGLNMLVGAQRETRVSRALQLERARREQEQIDARFAKLALEEKRKEEERTAKRAETQRRDREVLQLAETLGVDMDELPDLE